MKAEFLPSGEAKVWARRWEMSLGQPRKASGSALGLQKGDKRSDLCCGSLLAVPLLLLLLLLA